MIIDKVRTAKSEKRKLSAVTCYDATFARLIDQTDIDIVLVGDSLGNVMLGFENTIPVTMRHMLHHTAAVARVLRKPLLVADLPFLSYNSPQQALHNARRLMQSGAHAVKLEGGRAIVPQVRALVKAGVPVVGHLGLTPQSLYAFGGHKVQGRNRRAIDNIGLAAVALQEAGAFAVVLELVASDCARAVTKKLRIPVIGIGAGPDCDGQILVLHDILGLSDMKLKFVKQYAHLGQTVRGALAAYDREVKTGQFPTQEHSFRYIKNRR